MYIDDVVNIGNDHEISVLELARAIKKITDSRSEIVSFGCIAEGDMTDAN
jgi:nucleoside-diphosphate-sugar epimerase